MSNIESITFLDDEEETYDLEVDHPDHVYYLANGVLTSNSHATAYAYASYVCAYLHTHFEEEWLCSHLKASSNNPKKKAAAISDLRGLGYDIVDIDVNYATHDWTILPDRKFMPSLTSCKSVGAVAAEELISMRPYGDVVSMFWEPDGTWRFSKFNKKALSALIKVRAFSSLDTVGPGCVFSTWKQMHHILVDNIEKLKKSTKRVPTKGIQNFLKLVEDTADMDEWTKREFAEFAIEAFGSIDVGMLLSKETLEGLEEREIKPVEALEEGERDLCWFVISSVEEKKTKTGKDYLRLTIKGLDNSSRTLFLWNYKPEKDNFAPLDACVGEIEWGDFGLSSTCYKVKKLA